MTSNRPFALALTARSRPEVRDVSLVLCGTALTAICAQISIPWEPVPFTLQTFAVLLCGLTLGRRLGVASQILYLLLGGIGLPIFGSGRAGSTVLFGTTGGYLIGFVFATFVLGYAAERGWDRKPLSLVLSLVAGSACILVPGYVVLSQSLGWHDAYFKGVLPFIVGDGLKALAAAVLLPTAWRFVRG